MRLLQYKQLGMVKHGAGVAIKRLQNRISFEIQLGTVYGVAEILISRTYRPIDSSQLFAENCIRRIEREFKENTSDEPFQFQFFNTLQPLRYSIMSPDLLMRIALRYLKMRKRKLNFLTSLSRETKK